MPDYRVYLRKENEDPSILRPKRSYVDVTSSSERKVRAAFDAAKKAIPRKFKGLIIESIEVRS